MALAVLALKSAARAVTGSAPLFSDALENVVDVATTTAVVVALRISARPPDAPTPGAMTGQS